MPDITIRLPWGDPLTPVLLKLVDQGDGTHAPQITGGVATLTDPGNVWQAETVVAEGYRIAVSDAWVFECDGAGTTDSTEPGSWLLDGNDVADGTASWVYIGDIGGLATSTFSTYVGSNVAASVGAALAEQTVPQTNPSVQDVIDALVAVFGLVQSD